MISGAAAMSVDTFLAPFFLSWSHAVTTRKLPSYPTLLKKLAAGEVYAAKVAVGNRCIRDFQYFRLLARPHGVSRVH